MLVTITIAEDVQHLLDLLHPALLARAEVDLLNAEGHEGQEGLGASLTNKEALGCRGGWPRGAQRVVREERGARCAQQRWEEGWVQHVCLDSMGEQSRAEHGQSD